MHILVTRYLGQWGFDCQIIRKQEDLEAKDVFYFQVNGTPGSDEGAALPLKKIFGFGVDKFAAIENLTGKLAGKTLCYQDTDNAQQLVEMPAELSYGDNEDYASLVKNDEKD